MGIAPRELCSFALLRAYPIYKSTFNYMRLRANKLSRTSYYSNPLPNCLAPDPMIMPRVSSKQKRVAPKSHNVITDYMYIYMDEISTRKPISNNICTVEVS